MCKRCDDIKYHKNKRFIEKLEKLFLNNPEGLKRMLKKFKLYD